MDADVVVVGAGLAGLACALHLSAAGRAVALLEAGDAVGGRVRTDIVDGWRLDRGFQVHDTAYPELARLLDTPALDLRAFTPGALVHLDRGFVRVADPRRRPLSAPATLAAPVGSLADKARTAVLAGRIALAPPARLLAAPETTTYDALRAAGISERMVQRFWRPYLSGVFGEDELRTSSRFFSLVLRSQARGAQCLPAAGIGAIPEQLARRLPAGTLRLATRVERVEPGAAVTTDGRRVTARAVVVAADPPTAAALLPELSPPRMNALTTAYFAAPDHDPEPVLRLEGCGRTRGPITNAVAVPSEQPGVLLSVTGLGADVRESALRNHLRQWYGPRVDEWEHVATYRIPVATVDSPPPQGRFRRPVRVGPGRFVCGDHRDSASTQGAAVSGRRAAAGVLAELG